jgi:hypothetical protein
MKLYTFNQYKTFNQRRNLANLLTAIAKNAYEEALAGLLKVRIGSISVE